MSVEITDLELRGMVEARVAELLPEGKVMGLAREVVRERIEIVPILEAGPLLGCKNRRQTLELCRLERIPVLTKSTRRQYVELAEIVAWQRRAGRLVAAKQATVIARVEWAEEDAVAAQAVLGAATEGVSA